MKGGYIKQRWSEVSSWPCTFDVREAEMADWRGDVGGSKCLLLAVTTGECRFMLLFWLLTINLLFMAVCECVCSQSFEIERDSRYIDDTVNVDLVLWIHFVHSWFEITFPLNALLHHLPTSRVGSFLVLLCSKCLWVFTVPGSTEYNVSDCSCGPFNLMRCLPPIIIQLGAE